MTIPCPLSAVLTVSLLRCPQSRETFSFKMKSFLLVLSWLFLATTVKGQCTGDTDFRLITLLETFQTGDTAISDTSGELQGESSQ